MKYLIVQAYWYFDKITGEYHYRIGGPSEALAQDPRLQVVDIHVFHPLFPQLAAIADLLILHLLPDAEVWRLIHERRAAGKPTLFEIADNFLAPGPWVRADDAYRNPLVRQELLLHASLCDGCQYSTAEVAAVFAGLNPNARVFENQVNHFARPTRPRRPLTIGWGGSIGHREDLAQIAPTVIAFIRRHPDTRFLYMGHPPIYAALFAELGAQGEAIPAGPVETYYAFLERLHVGLAPLADTPFNRCRSDVKFIEYAAHGVVPLLADAAPYRVHARHGENALLFRTPQELAELLERLYADEEYLTGMSERCLSYAERERNRHTHAAERIAYYMALLPPEPGSAELPELPDLHGLITYLRSAIHALDENRPADALKTLDKLLNLYPSYQLAQLTRARALLVLERADEALNAMASAEFAPMYGDLHCELLARSAQLCGHGAWRELAAMVVNPVTRMALLEEPADRATRAQAVLDHHPWHCDSLRLLADAAQLPSSERTALKARLAFIDPPDFRPPC